MKEGLFILMGGLFQESTNVIVAAMFGVWVRKMEDNSRKHKP